MSLSVQFTKDKDGRKFPDVMSDTRVNFTSVLNFLDDPVRRTRMLDSEVHFDLPPLAGIVRELEGLDEVSKFLSQNDSHTTTRFRQAVGIAVRVVMEDHGWEPARRKGSLGKRQLVASGTTTPGAYCNEKGLSVWFTRAERYKPKTGSIG